MSGSCCVRYKPLTFSSLHWILLSDWSKTVNYTVNSLLTLVSVLIRLACVNGILLIQYCFYSNRSQFHGELLTLVRIEVRGVYLFGAVLLWGEKREHLSEGVSVWIQSDSSIATRKRFDSRSTWLQDAKHTSCVVLTLRVRFSEKRGTRTKPEVESCNAPEMRRGLKICIEE